MVSRRAYNPSLPAAWRQRDHPHFTGEVTEAERFDGLPEGLGIAPSQLVNCSSTPHRRGTGQRPVIKVLNLLTLYLSSHFLPTIAQVRGKSSYPDRCGSEMGPKVQPATAP